MTKILKIIDGKSIAALYSDKLKETAADIRAKGIIPSIALINASNDPASEIYIAKKSQLAEKIGIKSDIYKFSHEVSHEEISELIHKLNNDSGIHGILLQSPLAGNLNFGSLVNLIDPMKDVDGLTFYNQGKLSVGDPWIVPCTPLGILHLLKDVHKSLSGLHAVIIGRSTIVGRPMAQLLVNENCSVTLLHSRSKNISKISSEADILISAVGRAKMVNSSFVKNGATIIDVGINRIEIDGKKKIVGDVDFQDVLNVAGAITPVPNGVGPMTVIYLMHNTLKIANASVS